MFYVLRGRTGTVVFIIPRHIDLGSEIPLCTERFLSAIELAVDLNPSGPNAKVVFVIDLKECKFSQKYLELARSWMTLFGERYPQRVRKAFVLGSWWLESILLPILWTALPKHLHSKLSVVSCRNNLIESLIDDSETGVHLPSPARELVLELLAVSGRSKHVSAALAALDGTSEQRTLTEENQGRERKEALVKGGSRAAEAQREQQPSEDPSVSSTVGPGTALDEKRGVEEPIISPRQIEADEIKELRGKNEEQGAKEYEGRDSHSVSPLSVPELVNDWRFTSGIPLFS